MTATQYSRIFMLFAAISLLDIATATAQEDRFDHFRTRFPLVGAHQRVDCESCHVDGLFQGTPLQCRFCHDGTGLRATTARSTRHIPDTGVDCDNCHRVTRWDAARMDHAAVSDQCQQCHNGISASGKPMRHVASTDDCGDCHRSSTWGHARFDHGSITGSCMTCHDGMTAEGKHRDHLDTSSDCDLCHSTRRWVPSQFNHSDIDDPCSECHDNVQATGVPNNHFTTTLECDECHTTSRWTNPVYGHQGTNYPGDHRRNLACTRCHGGNSDPVTWDSPQYQPDCAACHASDFERDEHKKHENPDRDYTVSELRDCSGSCHVYTNSSLEVIKKRRNREHRVSDGDFD